VIQVEKEQKQSALCIGLSLVLGAAAYLLPTTGWVRLLCFLVPYLIAGYETLREAAEGILRGEVFGEEFLMSVATLGALALGEYPEAVAVMLLFRVGELLEDMAGDRARDSISALMDIRPDYANLTLDGEIRRVTPDCVAVGDRILVKPGEKLPLDGVVISGESTLDTAALTGEALPRAVRPGDTVLSGCVNGGGALTVEVTKPFGEATVTKILALVESASEKKSRSESFIHRFAARYTPAVCLAAAVLAVVPSLMTGNWGMWIRRALIFLVVSCPCALVISVPLTYFCGIGGLSRRGILVKGGSHLDDLSRAEIVVFDKTGTLTEGRFAVTELRPRSCGAGELLRLAAAADRYSDHPVAAALRAAAGEADLPVPSETEELPGRGVRAAAEGRTVLVGNARLMAENGIAYETSDLPGTHVHVAADGVYLGCILVSDRLKAGAGEAIAVLKKIGLRRTVMLTGDKRAAAETVAAALGLDETAAELLPGDKVAAVERLLGEKSPKGTLLFVGDGINDAPVLARADVGVAMGAMGSDAAIEAADVVLMDDDPAKLPAAIAGAKRTRRIAGENIAFALGVKALVLVLAAFGRTSMWAASFADVGVCVLAILNAVRAMK